MEARGLVAGAGEEGAELRDVEDVDETVRRVRGYVLAGRGGRNGEREVGGHQGDVEDVRVLVVVEVGGPCVVAALEQGVGARAIFDGSAEAIAVWIVGRDWPWRQVLRGVRPPRTVVAAVGHAVAVAVYRRRRRTGCAADRDAGLQTGGHRAALVDGDEAPEVAAGAGGVGQQDRIAAAAASCRRRGVGAAAEGQGQDFRGADGIAGGKDDIGDEAVNGESRDAYLFDGEGEGPVGTGVPVVEVRYRAGPLRVRPLHAGVDVDEVERAVVLRRAGGAVGAAAVWVEVNGQRAEDRNFAVKLVAVAGDCPTVIRYL